MTASRPSDRLFDGWERAWSGRDPAAFGPLCTDDVHYEDPLTPEPLQGVEALGAHAASLWTGMPDARVEAAGAHPCVDGFLAVPWRLRGTHSRPLGGLPATGRGLTLHGVFYCELDRSRQRGDGDRLLRARAFFDVYDAGRQLGLLPARGTLGERALLMIRGFGLRVRGA